MASTKMMKKIFAACKFCRLSIITGGSSEGRRRTAAFPRHCEPTGRANARPMTGSAKQSRKAAKLARLDRFVAYAPRNDV